MTLVLKSFIISRGSHPPLLSGVPIIIDSGVGYLPTCHRVWQENPDADVIGLLHDDLELGEDCVWAWVQELIVGAFADDAVGVVGFGGSLALGWDDIYKVPYDFRQLGRSRFLSNMTDAEAHGERITTPTDVAVVESFALFVRRSLLDATGGWPIDRYAPATHCSDLWICLQAHIRNLRVVALPIACTHRSGGSGPGYVEWMATTKWGSDEVAHRHNHRQLYEEFRGVLPIVVG